MTLALRMGRTAEELGHCLGSKEFVDWIAYDRSSPIGDERGDLQAALIAQVLFNMLRGQRTQPAELEDFVLKFGMPQGKSPQQIEDFLKAFTGAWKEKEAEGKN